MNLPVYRPQTDKPRPAPPAQNKNGLLGLKRTSKTHTPCAANTWFARGRVGWPELAVPEARERLPGPPNHPDALLKPRSSSEHRPPRAGASLELWARCRLPENAVP